MKNITEFVIEYDKHNNISKISKFFMKDGEKIGIRTLLYERTEMKYFMGIKLVEHDFSKIVVKTSLNDKEKKLVLEYNL